MRIESLSRKERKLKLLQKRKITKTTVSQDAYGEYSLFFVEFEVII